MGDELFVVEFGVVVDFEVDGPKGVADDVDVAGDVVEVLCVDFAWGLVCVSRLIM